MKVLIAADIFPPQSGGPATYAVNLANEFTKQGIDIKIVSLNPDSDASRVTCSVYPVTFKNKILKYLQYLWLLFKNSKNVDVIYAMGPVNAGLSALIVAKLCGKKFVVKVVGDYAWEQWQNQKSQPKDGRPGAEKIKNQNARLVNVDEFQSLKSFGKIGWLNQIERLVVKQANKVIVPSQYLKKIVISWGVKIKNIEVIYNEVEFKVAEPIKHPGEKWVVSVGRLVSWKGMDTLIEVLSDISKQFPGDGWKLKIVGDGPEMKNLMKQIEDNNLADIVQLTGNLPKEKTLSYIASANAFVLNSAYEGYSHVLVEAHNQGVPVIVSDAGGNSEMVTHSNLFEYNNKKEIEEKILFAGNIGKRESMQHSFENDMISETKKLLEQVCAN